MKLVSAKVYLRHFFVTYFDAARVAPRVQLRVDFEPLFRRCRCNQAHDRLVACQRLSTPILCYVAKQPVFYLVPFACTRGQMADRYR